MHQKEFNEQMNCLSKITDQLIQTNHQNDLNPLFNSLLEIFKTIDLVKINPLILNVLANNISAKILTIFLESPLTQTANSLIQFIASKNLLSPVYQSLLSQALHPSTSPTKNSPIKFKLIPSHLPSSEIDPFQIFDHNLEQLLKIDSKSEKYVNRNFGYSILDLSGQFIWCDEKSERVFETNSNGLFLRNLFDLMIPFSQNFLHQKFGGHLFENNPQVGSAVTFSYVVYSKTSMTQFVKCLKRFGVHDARDLKSRFENTHEENSIYHQYLRALSSRATIIPLKFTRTEFKGIIDSRKYNIHATRALLDLFKGPEFEVSEDNDDKQQPVNLTHFMEDCVAKSPPCEKYGLNIEERITENKRSNERRLPVRNKGGFDSDVIVMNAILLETRYASDFPRFEYNLMRGDPVIRGFEEKIIRKLAKDNLSE